MASEACMLTKCICTNCAGHLEFEEENAGERIACPHCGFETTLFLPGTQPEDPELTALARRLAWRRRLMWGAVGLALCAGIVYALWAWGLPLVQDLLPTVESKVVLWLVLILVCLLVPLALSWLAFPVVLCFQLRKLTRVLDTMAEGFQADRAVQVEPERFENGREESATPEQEETEDNT